MTLTLYYRKREPHAIYDMTMYTNTIPTLFKNASRLLMLLIVPLIYMTWSPLKPQTVGYLNAPDRPNNFFCIVSSILLKKIKIIPKKRRIGPAEWAHYQEGTHFYSAIVKNKYIRCVLLAVTWPARRWERLNRPRNLIKLWWAC